MKMSYETFSRIETYLMRDGSCHIVCHGGLDEGKASTLLLDVCA